MCSDRTYSKPPPANQNPRTPYLPGVFADPTESFPRLNAERITQTDYEASQQLMAISNINMIKSSNPTYTILVWKHFHPPDSLPPQRTHPRPHAHRPPRITPSNFSSHPAFPVPSLTL